MHAIKGAWAGQAFALASSNDGGGKKSRIRRSKEERKNMVESFIKTYQNSNDGNFPSLNLTHKEVGGSFYTVREIVREIIQENRVLAPPKVSLDENGHFKFLEQNPLGSISVEPENDLSVSDKLHTEELISSSSFQFIGPDPSKLNDEQIVNGVEEVLNSSEQLPESSSDEIKSEKIVSGGKVVEEKLDSDKPPVTNGVPIYHQEDKDEKALLDKNDQEIDKTEKSGQQIYKELVGAGILGREENEAKDVEISGNSTSQMNSNLVVEKFPLRPVSRTILDLDEEKSGKFHEANGISEDSAIKHDEMTFVESPFGLVNEKDETKLQDSTSELNSEYKDEKVVINLPEQSLEKSEPSTTFQTTVNGVGDVKDLEPKEPLSEETKQASISTERSIPENSTKSSGHDKNDIKKEKNPVLDRINLETWEGASKKSSSPENNPLLELVKSFISAFVKFWTE